MKKAILLKISMCFALLTLMSCEKDADIQLENDQNLRVTEKSFDELTQDLKFKSAIAKVLKKANINSRTAMENQYGFSIADLPAKVITSESTTSYTLLIERDNQSESYFENLVIKVNSQNSISASILKYTPTKITAYPQHNSFTFEGTRSLTSIEVNSHSFESKPENNYVTQGCLEITTIMCNWGGTEHPAGHNCTQTYPVTMSFCWDDPESDSGGGDYSGGDTSGNGSGGDYSGGGGAGDTSGGNGTNDPIEGDTSEINDPMMTSPISPNLGSPQAILTSQTNAYINTLPNNLTSLVQVNNFIFPAILNLVTQDGLNTQTKEIIRNALLKFKKLEQFQSSTMTTDELIKFKKSIFQFLISHPDYDFEIDNSLTAQNSLNLDSMNEFESFLDSCEEESTNFEYIQNQSQKTAKVKLAMVGPLGGINFNIIQNISPSYSVENVTSTCYGFTLAFSWAQTGFDKAIVNNNAIINVYGDINYNVFMEGLGTVWTQPKQIRVKTNTTNGQIISATTIK
ncbi:hypothetical protein [Flavobacterium humi]|uniref:Lipoprotein n=1 Tax=Flavobacterium humi TaxID=2562683 RepID=A0A4Z0L5B4_9FLAO|nr:hypothetical protein [Flavobacterium humi]TGD56762.1 hypothetical protein E4635_15075 [Flavobacterium humi]